jgi:hypothetical protein
VETYLTRGRMKVGEAPPFAESERVKLPEDVAPIALWLATQQKSGRTGQSFSIASVRFRYHPGWRCMKFPDAQRPG